MFFVLKLVKGWGGIKDLSWSNCFSPTLSVPSPALIASLPVNRFPNKITSSVPDNMPRIPPFCYFASVSIVLLTPYINKPFSLRDLVIFLISSIPPFEIIIVLILDPKLFF